MKYTYRLSYSESQQWHANNHHAETFRAIIRHFARLQAMDEKLPAGVIRDTDGEDIATFETTGPFAAADAAVFDSRPKKNSMRSNDAPA